MIPNYSTTVKPELTIKQLWAETPVAAPDRTSALIIGPQYTGQSLSASSTWVRGDSLVSSEEWTSSYFIPVPGAPSDLDLEDVTIHYEGYRGRSNEADELRFLGSYSGVSATGVVAPAVTYSVLIANGAAVKNASRAFMVDGTIVTPIYFSYSTIAGSAALEGGAIYTNATGSSITVGAQTIPARRFFVAVAGDTAPVSDDQVALVTPTPLDVTAGGDVPFDGDPLKVGALVLFTSADGTGAVARTVTETMPATGGLVDLTAGDTPITVLRGSITGGSYQIVSASGGSNRYYTGLYTTEIVVEVLSPTASLEGESDEIAYRVSDSRGLITPYVVSKSDSDETVNLGFNLLLDTQGAAVVGTSASGGSTVFSFPVTPGVPDAVSRASFSIASVVSSAMALPTATASVSRLDAIVGRFYVGIIYNPFSGVIPAKNAEAQDQLVISEQDGQVGITVFTSPYVASSYQVALYYGRLFVEWKQIVEPAEFEPPVLVDATTVEDELGSAFASNLLRNAVDAALKGSGGKAVYALRSAGEGDEDYTNALDRVESFDSAMFLSAPTFSRATRLAFKAHIEAVSQESVKNWRRGYLPLDAPEDFALLAAKASGTPYTMTISEHDEEFVLVECADALFTSLGIRAGDRIRYNFATLADGVGTFTPYAIRKVLSDTQLLLESGPGAAITSATRFEIWKSNTADNMVTYCNNEAALLSAARVNLVWSDGAQTIDTATGAITSVDMRYAGAYVAGLRSATPAVKGLTNTTVGEFIQRAPLFYTKYKARHVEQISAGGVWVLGQENPSTTPKIYHQVTTSTSEGPALYEDNVGVRHDIADYAIKDAYSAYIGSTEASTITLGELYRVGREILSNLASDKIPGTESTIITNFRSTATKEEGTFDIDFHPTNKATFVAAADLEIPLPLNRVEWITTGYAGTF